MWLEDEQKELLARFVEAHRNTPHELRGKFITVETMGDPQATFIHSRARNVRFRGSSADAEVLAQAGFLGQSYGSGGSPLFFVLPDGIQFYETMRRDVTAVETVENEIRRFLSASEFRESHGAAAAKWNQAASLLWSADSQQQLTTIGHLCREALQEFAASLATQHHVDVSHIEAAKTVARLKAIVATRTASLETSKGVSALLDAMISFWGAASDLVQRQEHGAQREGTALAWEDARRVVFQSCVVMYEVNHALA